MLYIILYNKMQHVPSFANFLVLFTFSLFPHSNQYLLGGKWDDVKVRQMRVNDKNLREKYDIQEVESNLSEYGG